MAGQRNLEELLRLNVNELAQDLAREYGLACKKAGIYGPDHPAALKAAEKPFLAMRKFSDVRRVLSLHLMRGKLAIAQIQLKETHLTDQFVQYLQMLDIFGLLFDEKMSVRDLSVFLNVLTRREHRFASRFDMSGALKQHGVTTIEVNSERAMRFFEERKQYRGEIAGDYTVRHLLSEQLPTEPLPLARVWRLQDNELESHGIDYRGFLVSQLQPERIATMPRESFVTALREQAGDPAMLATLQVMASFHPDRNRLIGSVTPNQEQSSEPLDQIAVIRKDARLALTESIQRATKITASNNDLSAAASAFERVVKTGQSDIAESTIRELLTSLSASDVVVRRQHVQLLHALLNRDHVPLTPFQIALAVVTGLLQDRKESFEHGEIGVALIDRFLADHRYAELVPLAQALERRVDRLLGITTIDSPVVKRLRDTFHEGKHLGKLVSHGLRPSMLSGKSEQQAALQLVAALCSEEVAAELAAHISDAERTVRQTVLKTLGEMGPVAESVCVSLLHEVRHQSLENPDRWYKIRNAFHVLGHLQSSGATTVLRTLVDDLDPRVRTELVSCLEKIRIEESLELLLECASDPDKGVRAAAAAALGSAGDQASVQAIILMLQEAHDIDATKLIAALGRIGGPEAKKFLFDLLGDSSVSEHLQTLASRDELRASVIRALGAIADPEALAQVRRYSESIPFTQRLLLRSSLVGEALSEVLEKRS